MSDLVRVNVVLDTTALDDLRQALVNSPREFYGAINTRILPQAQKKLDAVLNTEPGPTVHPFEFGTPKSRRYYFATHKGGYKRTGEVRQWRVILKAFSGQTIELIFENPSPAAPFVFGSPTQRQIPGHAATGWRNADKELPALTGEVVENLAEVWVEQFNAKRSA